MAGKSLADNHLSSLARKGRYGDTELVHVNEQEKSMLEAMGGSGGINPDTGLKEYNPLMVAQLTLAGLGAFTSGSAQEDKSRMEQQMSQEALKRLDLQEKALDTGVVSKKKAEIQKYTMGVEELSAETGIAKEDLKKQADKAIEMSGGIARGGSDQKKSEMWGRVKDAFGRGRGNLLASLGGAMGEIEGWYESKKAGIAADRSSLMATIDFAKQREGAFYLGKGLKHVGKKLFG